MGVEFVVYALAAFLAGVLTFLAPCTLPLIPAYLASMGVGRSAMASTSTALFSIGVAGMFTFLGVSAGSVGKAALAYKQEVMLASGVVLISIGILSLFGKTLKLFSFSPARPASAAGQLLFGGLFALTWSGCIGPVLGVLLVLAANTATAFAGGALLFIYSLGLLFPLIGLSGLIDRLPREGRVWTLLRGKLFAVPLAGKVRYVHSTNVLSSVLFITLGLGFIVNAKYGIAIAYPDAFTSWVFSVEETLVRVLGLDVY